MTETMRPSRIFLSEMDWQALRLHGLPPPDSSGFKQEVPLAGTIFCWFCGQRGSESNPLTAAHRIPARMIREFGFTPRFLNRAQNFVWAHRRSCNGSAEFDVGQIMWLLLGMGVKELPSFLSSKLLSTWNKERAFFSSKQAPVEAPMPVLKSNFRGTPNVAPGLKIERAEQKKNGKPVVPAALVIKIAERKKFGTPIVSAPLRIGRRGGE